MRRGDGVTSRRRPLPGAVAVAAVVAGALVVAVGVPVAAAEGGSVPEVGLEMPATAVNQSRGPSNNSPALAADPTQPKFVVMAHRLDAPDFGCALQLSGDGGRTWVPANPVPSLPAGVEKCYAPEVAFDREGVLYYLFVGLAGRGNEATAVFLTQSSDRGQSFATPRQILGQFNFGVRMAIDTGIGAEGRMHVVWLRATSDPGLGAFGPPPNPVMAFYSDDGGETFSEPVQVSDVDRGHVVAPALALGPDQRVNVAYYDLGDDARDYRNLEGPVWDGTWSIVVSRSTDGGRSFSPGVVVDDAIAPPERPMLIFTMTPPAVVADPGGGLCLAWSDARNGDPDVVARCSSDALDTWRPPVRLNDDAKGNGARQYLPRLGVSSGGRIDAIFLDRRHDPQNLHNDVFYTSSTDGGRRFSPNVKLTRVASNAQIGAQYAGPSAAGQYEIGSRLGLLSRRSDALAAWPDTRNYRSPGTGQDLYTADIGVAGGGGGVGGWLAAGGVIVAAGVVAGMLVGRRRNAQRARPGQAQPAGDPKH